MKRPAVLAGLLALLALLWGGMRWQAGRWRAWVASASREELQTYAQSHPDQPEVQARLGVLLRDAGEQAQAESALRHAVELAPSEITNWIEFSRALTDDQEAIKSLQDCLKLNPDSPPVLAEVAHRYLLAGDSEQARILTEKARKLAPDSPEAWRSTGEIAAAARLTPDAEKAFRKSLALQDDSETRLGLAHLLIPLQRYPEVVALCEPLLKPTPSISVSRQQRARALLYTAGGRLYSSLTSEEIASIQAQLQEAEGLASTLSPDERFLPPYFLGESFLRAGKPKQALPYLERSIALGPMFAGSLYSLARAYRLAGETAKADAASVRHARLSRILGDLDKYSSRLQQRPNDADTLLRLGDTLAEAGNKAEAAQIYRRLIGMGKNVSEAQRKLNQLSGVR